MEAIGGAGLCGEPGGQAGELAFQRRHVLLGQVVPDQAQVQVPTPRPPVGPLDPRRHHGGVARPDQARSFQPAKARPHGTLRQTGVAHQRPHRRERAATIRTRVVGQANEHELARAGRLAAAIGRDRGQVERPGDRLHTHRAPAASRSVRQPWAPGLGSVLGPFIPVRGRSPPATRDTSA